MPVHEVTVPSFHMLKTEVTVAQYRECVTAGSCTAPSTPWPQCNWNDPSYERHPANCVTWQQSADFCAWAGGRLPSEAQWEYAASSGGQNIPHPWGNEEATCDYAVMHGGSEYWELGSGCGTARTWPVCSKPAGNTYQGLCDMIGNADEWIQDVWHRNYDGAPADGSAWEETPSYETGRVIRGGSYWRQGQRTLVTEREDPRNPLEHRDDLSFRCVR